MDIDIIYGQIKKYGNSHIIIIPPNMMKFGGYSEGDVVKVIIRKNREDD